MIQSLSVRTSGVVRPAMLLVRLLVVLVATVLFSACSTTNSDVRQISRATDVSSAEGAKLAVVGEVIQTSSQQDGRLYTLHSKAETVLALTRIVARHYGFRLENEAEADYVLEIVSALPDGGACISGVESAELNFSYSLSLLTLGAFPATAVHCLVVVANLYANQGGERELMGQFDSGAGSVEIVAGVNDLRTYQKSVRPEDEQRGLEASIGSLLSELIEEGAFQP